MFAEEWKPWRCVWCYKTIRKIMQPNEMKQMNIFNYFPLAYLAVNRNVLMFRLMLCNQVVSEREEREIFRVCCCCCKLNRIPSPFLCFQTMQIYSFSWEIPKEKSKRKIIAKHKNTLHTHKAVAWRQKCCFLFSHWELLTYSWEKQQLLIASWEPWHWKCWIKRDRLCPHRQQHTKNKFN